MFADDNAPVLMGGGNVALPCQVINDLSGVFERIGYSKWKTVFRS